MEPEASSPSSAAAPGSYRELFRIALPLILSTSTMSLMHVIDRIFLSHYSADALAACVPSGAMSFLLVSGFMGTASYVSTFVSQYDGAGQPRRIGAVLWQGIYFSLLGSIALAALAFIGRPFFAWVGHDAAVQQQEVIYFEVMTWGGGAIVLSSALASFYSGRGRTWIILWANLVAAVVNLVLAYCMIFGRYGFPEWGIFGAGISSVAAFGSTVLIYVVMISLPHNRRQYNTLADYRFDLALFLRLLRFGLPSGLQVTIEVAAFTLFLLMVGNLGLIELAATNVAFTVNHLVFVPMLGLAMATTVLVGRYQGASRPDLAEQVTQRALHLVVGYMATFSVLLALNPRLFIVPFRPADTPDFGEIEALAVRLLYFVAAYSAFDAIYLTYGAALKGAGDTRFVLIMILTLGLFGLVVPTYIACVVLGYGILVAWVIILLYVIAFAVCFWLRFHAGYWRTMRVIEQPVTPVPGSDSGPLLDA